MRFFPKGTPLDQRGEGDFIEVNIEENLPKFKDYLLEVMEALFSEFLALDNLDMEMEDESYFKLILKISKELNSPLGKEFILENGNSFEYNEDHKQAVLLSLMGSLEGDLDEVLQEVDTVIGGYKSIRGF